MRARTRLTLPSQTAATSPLQKLASAAAVLEPEIQIHPPRGLRRVVREAGGGDVAVGDVYLLVVVGQKRDVEEAHARDRAARRAGLDEVAGLEGARHKQRYAREDVRERVLKREGEREARHAHQRDERGGGDVELAHYHEQRRHPEHDALKIHYGALDGRVELRLVQRAAREPDRELYDREADEEYQRRGQDVPEREAAYIQREELRHGLGYGLLRRQRVDNLCIYHRLTSRVDYYIIPIPDLSITLRRKIPLDFSGQRVFN